MIVLAVLAAILVAMQGRTAWYALTDWTACARLEAASDVVTLVDRIAFCCAALAAFAGWLWRRRMQIFFALGAVLTAVACDGVLTAFRLSGWEYSAEFLVPLASMTIEIACAAALILHIGFAVRRTAAAGALAS